MANLPKSAPQNLCSFAGNKAFARYGISGLLSGGNTNGLGLRVVNYTDNTLNQVTSRDVAPFVDVLGASILTNAVTVNGQAPLRLARPVMLAQQQPPMNLNIPADPNPMQQAPRNTFQTP